ncbi:expressed unknown protein [Seminavis robusta]|uniref:Zinc finger PHD-type domain-containing protein n=1 Tax=Seminavis robusta TaxID=568900 RepID=A0A9N8EQ30_9STRA|nr:expressed unknown protein [Seminavis robusta]|eukprot:Sro1380_g267800.1 n/a (479) ;mRNA; f:22083-23519
MSTPTRVKQEETPAAVKQEETPAKDTTTSISSPCPSSSTLKSPGGGRGPKCDVCGFRDGRHGMKMVSCTECKVHVHRDCYGMPTYIKDEFVCWACQAVGKSFYVHHRDNNTHQRVKLQVTQTERPQICDLCGHQDDDMHAMHPVYDTYGPRARQLHVPITNDNNDDTTKRRLVWAHTICGFFLCTQNCMYAVSQEGTTHEGLEDNPKDDRSINPELQLEDDDDDEDEENDLYDGFAPSHHFVYYVPKDANGVVQHTSRSREINRRQQLKCEICNQDDTADHVYRIPVQCSAGERTEPREHRVKHSDLQLDKNESCTHAFHVGCARFTMPQEHKRVLYFPGLPDDSTAKPVRCIYCPVHAKDINKKEHGRRLQQQDDQLQAHKAKRKLAMAQKYGRALTLSSPTKRIKTGEDDSSLPALERVKRDLEARVIHIRKEQGKAWIQEQKKLWSKRLSKEELKAVWKHAKEHAYKVWEKHNGS